MKYYLLPIDDHISAGVSYGDDIPSTAVECSEDIYTNAWKFKILNGDIIERDITENLASIERLKRNDLLSETDYMLISDYNITDEKLSKIKTYRQMLRDITTQPGFPITIDWPPKPE